ncbi:hypothetical protein HUJ05_010163 [Dendroctonus ponderosae]|nr:hypothetical protein HUJ05_010163 [Dendroctonus ponderosae]
MLVTVFQLRLIQVYGPTSTYSDEDTELIYEGIRLAREQSKCKYEIVMGDFNAIQGKQGSAKEEYIGKYGFGTRNQRGSDPRLVRDKMILEKTSFREYGRTKQKIVDEEMLHQNREAYKGKLQSHINNLMKTDDINEVASDITGVMRKVANEVAERKSRKTNKKSCETKLKKQKKEELCIQMVYTHRNNTNMSEKRQGE